jgi:hypothetical protein
LDDDSGKYNIKYRAKYANANGRIKIQKLKKYIKTKNVEKQFTGC